jgi:hypothetical protein
MKHPRSARGGTGVSKECREVASKDDSAGVELLGARTHGTAERPLVPAGTGAAVMTGARARTTAGAAGARTLPVLAFPTLGEWSAGTGEAAVPAIMGHGGAPLSATLAHGVAAVRALAALIALLAAAGVRAAEALGSARPGKAAADIALGSGATESVLRRGAAELAPSLSALALHVLAHALAAELHAIMHQFAALAGAKVPA